MESSGCPVFKELMSKKFLEWWRWKTLGKRVWLSQWWMENCQQTYLESMEKDIKIILEIENKEQEVINKLTDVGTIIQALQSSVRHVAMSTLARGRTHHMRETLLSLSRIWCPSHTPHHIFDYLLNSCLSEFQELKSSKMTSSLPELPCPTSSRHSINIDWSNEWMAVTLERVVLYGMPGGWRREDGLQRTVQMVREESGERSANKSLKNCDWE